MVSLPNPFQDLGSFEIEMLKQAFEAVSPQAESVQHDTDVKLFSFPVIPSLPRNLSQPKLC
jgi:hypothetical protein